MKVLRPVGVELDFQGFGSLGHWDSEVSWAGRVSNFMGLGSLGNEGPEVSLQSSFLRLRFCGFGQLAHWILGREKVICKRLETGCRGALGNFWMRSQCSLIGTAGIDPHP